ncbi:MAG TPA: glycerate kinase, partial [Isosphaeraceae bacterium]|nr:glycerate kinase [Isosphaeraceae bacterium]
MKILIAPDKFKGSLSAADVAEAMARGVAKAVPQAQVDRVPMADGGEGTVEALVAATGGRFLEEQVTGPLGEPVRARYGMLGDGQTAVVEMAAASGLVLVPTERRDPLRATTRGTGELILAAIVSGARKIIVGIGGSATNDGGAGLAQALGYRLLDGDGRDLEPGGGALDRLARIDTSGRDRRLDGVEVAVACDVDNPLFGPKGASTVYGPQKGATPAMVATLDR